MTQADARLQQALGDGYRVERELGGGGMSRVYLVEETRLRRRIVLKVLPAELAAELSLARFDREIALAATLQHPHIVPLLFTGEFDGLPYYSMPFVDGETLRERMARAGELPVAEAVRLLREVATALAYAHDKGLVHRDIKPENILLSGGIALVADFGVAKALVASTAAGNSQLTTGGMAIGTPAYMSPEQVAADPLVDHRADIYSFGMMAYEMLAGQAPFAGRPLQALLAAHVTDTPEPLERRRPAVPAALAALIMQCLEKRPADRPQHASDIVQSLDALTVTSPATTRHTVPVKSRGRAAYIAGAVALVGLLGAGAWWKFGNKPTPVAASSRLLIAPFVNLTGDARFESVGRIAADRLAFTVGQQGGQDVVPSNTVLMAMRDTSAGIASQLERLSLATHAALLMTGTIVQKGDSLILAAQVTRTGGGEPVFGIDPVSGPANDPIAIVTAVGDRLLGALAARGVAILPKASRAPTNAAYQEFEKGFTRFALFGDYRGARPYFERAIALDPTYVRAYQLLARQYINSGEFDRADSIARVIEALPTGMNAIERMQADYNNAEVEGDVQGMLRAQQRLVAYDSSPLALALTGEAAIFLARPDLAIPALERAVPAFLVMGGNAAFRQAMLLAEAYHLGGNHVRELAFMTENRAAFQDLGWFRGRTLRARAGLHNKEQALALADSMLGASTDSAGVLITRITDAAQEFRAHGDSATGLRLLALARTWVGQHPAHVALPKRLMSEGVLYLLSNMPDSAMKRFAIVATDTSRIDAAGYLALSYAQRNDTARGDRARAQAAADSIGAIRRRWQTGVPTFWRAAVAGALGDRELAVQLLEQSSREGQYMDTWHYLPALNALHGFGPFEALLHPR